MPGRGGQGSRASLSPTSVNPGLGELWGPGADIVKPRRLPNQITEFGPYKRLQFKFKGPKMPRGAPNISTLFNFAPMLMYGHGLDD